jgi:hypothetical protein
LGVSSQVCLCRHSAGRLGLLPEKQLQKPSPLAGEGRVRGEIGAFHLKSFVAAGLPHEESFCEQSAMPPWPLGEGGFKSPLPWREGKRGGGRSGPSPSPNSPGGPTASRPSPPLGERAVPRRCGTAPGDLGVRGISGSRCRLLPTWLRGFPFNA